LLPLLLEMASAQVWLQCNNVEDALVGMLSKVFVWWFGYVVWYGGNVPYPIEQRIEVEGIRERMIVSRFWEKASQMKWTGR